MISIVSHPSFVLELRRVLEGPRTFGARREDDRGQTQMPVICTWRRGGGHIGAGISQVSEPERRSEPDDRGILER